MNDKLRKRIYTRDNGRCWHCGTDENVTIHHRVNRGMGGSKLLDMPSNLVVMCAAFNQAMESDLRAHKLAKEMGWKVSRHSQPSKVPIQSFVGEVFLLDDMFRMWMLDGNREDGGRSPQE